MAKRSKATTLALTALHVGVFAELGVLTRLYLDKLFQDGCSRGWGLCLTSAGKTSRSYGAYFTELPSNMLGSFFMGALATSAALGLAVDKAVALLPAGHPWQNNAALQTGLRTGYCGSLTTFSAWQLQEMLLFIGGTGRDGGQWAQALWAIFIGMETSLASLVMGHHAALAVHRWLLPEGRQDSKPDGAHPTAVPSEFRGRRAMLMAARQRKEGPVRGVKMGKAAAAGHAMTRADSPQLDAPEQEAERELGWESGSADAADGTAAAQNGADTAAGSGASAAAAKAAAAQGDGPGASTARGPGRRRTPETLNPGRARRRPSTEELENEVELGFDEEGPAGANEEAALEQKAAAANHRWHHGWKTHIAVALLGVALTALFVVLTIVDTRRQHSSRRAIWLGVLMGPFGALLRWQLAGWNSALPGRLGWFPAGTFAANFLACVVIFAVEVPVDVTVLDYWPDIVVVAIQKGFCGALSTVSTFVNEIHAMLEVYPDHFHAHTYIFVSFAATWLAGVAIYGAPAWAHM